jgi:glutamyl-tRNA reductase
MTAQEIHVIALTHKQLPLTVVGQFTLPEDVRASILLQLKSKFEFSELMYLATCNRVELVFASEKVIDTSILKEVLYELSQIHFDETLLNSIEFYSGNAAAKHLLRVVASLESMMVGEREIITQFRKAFEFCQLNGLTGDRIRLLARQCIETAKQIHTSTQMNGKPVSVASFAWKKIKEFGNVADQKVLLIGAGQMMKAIAKYMHEEPCKEVTMYNRTVAHAEAIMKPVHGTWNDLKELPKCKFSFDVLVICTSSHETIVSKDIFVSPGKQEQKRLVIDLSVPSNVDKTITEIPGVCFIGMHEIGEEVSANIKHWENAIKGCEPMIDEALIAYNHLLKQRMIEKMMSEVPTTIKEIRSLAMSEVFANEMSELDPKSQAILNSIVDYLEKKYISVPMKMAREVLLTATHNKV